VLRYNVAASGGSDEGRLRTAEDQLAYETPQLLANMSSVARTSRLKPTWVLRRLRSV